MIHNKINCFPKRYQKTYESVSQKREQKKGAIPMQNEYWKLFEKSGSIMDYLNYACTTEESMKNILAESGEKYESGDRNGNGFISNAGRRV